MIVKVLSAALVAGFLAACVGLALQVVLTRPLILQAEAFERLQQPQRQQAQTGRFGPGLLHLAHEGHSHEAPSTAEAGEWEPGEGLPRIAFTGLATLVSGVGYALLLLASMLAAGSEPKSGRALGWALGGFAAVSLAPAIGLPPELPGMGGHALEARQVWWIATAAGTGLGLYLIAVVRHPVAIAIGLAAIIAPHLVGAPTAGDGGAVPSTLAAQFAARSIALSAVFWVALGLALGWIWPRLDKGRAGEAVT